MTEPPSFLVLARKRPPPRRFTVPRTLDPTAELEAAAGHYPSTRTELVSVLVSEGDLDGAWREATDGGCADALLLQLADAFGDAHPDHVAAAYRRQVDRCLEGTQHYRDAVALLTRWRAMLGRHGGESDLDDDVRRLRDQDRRRPSFIAKLDKAGFGPDR